jgi:hypothetical protein
MHYAFALAQSMRFQIPDPFISGGILAIEEDWD